MEKICGKNAVKPEQLPSTLDSANHHFLRVHYQIQTWLGRTLDPFDWGWQVQNDRMVPLFTTKPPAAPELLIYIRCGCKEDGRGSANYLCVNHGAPCSLSCAKCNGVSCNNPQIPELGDDH